MAHAGRLQSCVSTAAQQFSDSPSCRRALSSAAARAHSQALQRRPVSGLLFVHISFKQKQEVFLRLMCVAGQFIPFFFESLNAVPLYGSTLAPPFTS